MFTITVNDIERIFQDYGIYEHCAGFSELQRYHYEEDDPDSKEVRLIVKAETNSGSAVVIRFKNEADVTLDTVTAQSKFAVLLAENGIETPRIYHANGQYARWYQISGYKVIVTVEDFVGGELKEVDTKTAEQTGRLLARMHNVSEMNDFHVQNNVLFHPLKRNDLFSFEDFAVHKEYLKSVHADLYHKIVLGYSHLLEKVRFFENEPQYAVQGDISDCNLYRNAYGTIGVFDFNRCGDNVLYYDAVMQAVFEARLMVYPKEIAKASEAVILPAFLKGYHQERPFTDRQIEVFPYLYALISAFWLFDMRWSEHSLANAIEQADADAALNWMKEICNRMAYLPSMPL